MSPEMMYAKQRKEPCSPRATKTSLPLVVGDALHVLNPEVYRAICREDATTLEMLAQRQLDAGAQALAVNLGPGREVDTHTAWVADTLQRVADVPLFFSANILRHHEVLKKHGERITINAISTNRDELRSTLQVADEFGCSVVVLLVRTGKLRRGVEDKLELAFEVLALADTLTFPKSQLYLDPVLTPHPDPISWQISRGYPDIGSAVETISLVKELDIEVKSIVALGNTSRLMQRRENLYSMLRIFNETGTDAVLVDWSANLGQEMFGGCGTASLHAEV